MTPEDEVLAAACARADALARGDTFDRETYVRRNTGGDVRWHGQTLEDVRVVVVDENGGAALHRRRSDRGRRPGGSSACP